MNQKSVEILALKEENDKGTKKGNIYRGIQKDAVNHLISSGKSAKEIASI
ncbi:MAG: hypothetical protein HS129_00590 [Leptospiraceae bacterium]|nr:hypothetical protein [Leptospiraceae bacterium]